MNDRYERYQYIYGNTVRKAEVPVQEPEREAERRQHTTTKTKVRRNPKVLEFNSRFTALVAVCVALVVLLSVTYLYGQSMISKQMTAISRKQTTLASINSKSQSLEANLEKKVDYDAIKQQAVELGMIVPGEQNIFYYEGTPDDYVRQYADIPDGN